MAMHHDYVVQSVSQCIMGAESNSDGLDSERAHCIMGAESNSDGLDSERAYRGVPSSLPEIDDKIIDAQTADVVMKPLYE